MRKILLSVPGAAGCPPVFGWSLLLRALSHGLRLQGCGLIYFAPLALAALGLGLFVSVASTN